MTAPPLHPSRFGAAAALMTASVALSRCLGLVREMVVAHVGGATAAVDAYQVAFLLPDVVNHLLAGGFLGVTFLPLFSAHLARRDPAAAGRLAGRLLTAVATAGCLLAAAAHVAADPLLKHLAPGLPPAWRAEAVRLTRIMLPAQPAFLLGGLLLAMQLAAGRFLLPALAPLAYNGGIILGGLLLGPRWGMAGFAWGVLAGALVGHLVLPLVAASRLAVPLRPARPSLRDRELRTYLRLTLPLALGLTLAFAVEFLIRFFGSLLGAGDVARLNYGFRLMLALVAVVGQGGAQASYPFLARLAASEGPAALDAFLGRVLERVGALLFVGAGLLFVIAPEAVALVYRHGRFRPEDVAPTAAVLRLFLLGSPGWVVTMIVTRAYFARQDTWRPAGITTAVVLLSLPLYAWATAAWGARGVAAATAAAMWLGGGALFGYWRLRVVGGPPLLPAALGRAALAAVAAAVLAWAVKGGLNPPGAAAGAAVAAIPYGLVLLGLRAPLGLPLPGLRFGSAAGRKGT